MPLNWGSLLNLVTRSDPVQHRLIASMTNADVQELLGFLADIERAAQKARDAKKESRGRVDAPPTPAAA